MSDLLYDKEINCLYCEGRFKTKKIRHSKLGVSKQDSDFCTYYTNEESPYYYEIWVCPHCGYAFNASSAKLKPAQKECVKKEYIARSGSIDLCGVRTWEEALLSYKLGLICASIAGDNNTNIAGICLRIAWLYRFSGSREEENKFLAKAVKVLEEIYEEEDLQRNPLGEQKIIYLLGELNGRLGNFNETRRWFNLLLTQRDIEPAIANLAREQWTEYKANLKNK